jgi:hypothetical protein
MRNGAQSWGIITRSHVLTRNSSAGGSIVEALSLLILMIPAGQYRNLQNAVLYYNLGWVQSRPKVDSPQALWASPVGVGKQKLAVPTPTRQHLPSQACSQALVGFRPIPWDSMLSTIQWTPPLI